MARPSIAQIQNRWNSGHKSALKLLAEGKPLWTTATRLADIKGMQVVRRTLLENWGAINADNTLTDFGRELLEIIKAEDTAWAEHYQRTYVDRPIR